MENGRKTKALVDGQYVGQCAMDLLFMNQTFTAKLGSSAVVAGSALRHTLMQSLCRQQVSSCGRCRRQRPAVHLSSASAAAANIRRNINHSQYTAAPTAMAFNNMELHNNTA